MVNATYAAPKYHRLALNLYLPEQCVMKAMPIYIKFLEDNAHLRGGQYVVSWIAFSSVAFYTRYKDATTIRSYM